MPNDEMIGTPDHNASDDESEIDLVGTESDDGYVESTRTQDLI